MPTYDVRKESVQPQHTLVIKTEVLPHELGDELGKILPRVHAYLEKKGVAASGPPFARYMGFGDKLEIEAGLPVSAAVDGDGDIEASELPGGDAAVTTHIGPYDELPQAHAALVSWTFANKRKANGGPFESYLTDPGDEPDSSKWQTRVILALEPA